MGEANVPGNLARRVEFLLGAQILLILLLPVANSTTAPVRLILGTVVLVMAVNLVGAGKRNLGIALTLGITALATRWLNQFTPYSGLLLVGATCTSILYIYVLRIMMIWLRRSHEVGRETIQLAISTYILLGVMWVSLYSIVAIVTPDDPGAFTSSYALDPELFYVDLHYFSFVTLTTLGYGDIIPVAPLAKSLAVLEAMTGVLYLAVTIASLVGKAASGPDRKHDQGKGP